MFGGLEVNEVLEGGVVEVYVFVYVVGYRVNGCCCWLM